jgi:aspartyl-tRNA(Asn)/glutamyl-tRNA(Gln) amidotransferase subunit B
MAISQDIKKQYIPTIGIETHVQLKTKTKLFSAVGNDAREAAPNTLISHIDVGMPGALPVLNEGAIELACLAAFALNTEPQKHSYFERKHYFYPDLPMGYQISQLHAPIIVGGSVELETDGQKKKININRAQLEADAGKNMHPEGADYSLVDLNRAGTPLLEIVSEPEIHSGAEAKAYVRELYLLMKYAGISDVDLYHGNMRFDVNVSVSKEANKPGIRTETKNLNSFRSVEKIIQETRGWDEAKQKTTSQRSKEEAQDYRYMPEPDIPPVDLKGAFVEKMREKLPELPTEIRRSLSTINIDEKVIEDVLERDDILPRVLQAANKTTPENSRHIVFQLLEEPENLQLRVDDQINISQMVNAKKLSSTAAKEALADMRSGKNLEEATKSRIQVSDEGEIEKIVAEVLAENEKAAQDVKNGENKAIGFLVGQVMKKSAGKANPQLSQQLIKKHLGI